LQGAEMSPIRKRRVGVSASVLALEPAWPCAPWRPGAHSEQHARFARDAGALRCRGEARQRCARASRYR